MDRLSRRSVVRGLAATGAAALLPPLAFAQQNAALTKPIPYSGEAIPVIGLGSWITFNVGDDRQARDACVDVMRAFFAAGGRMIDSSPMYGSSQGVIGYGLNKLGKASVFAADKVWISSAQQGPAQIEESRRHWGVQKFDLLQVHNLVAWQKHLETLFAMKAKGQLRYVGITTSEGRRHSEFEQVMRKHPLDFVQFSYNVRDREVEQRLLPLAKERGMAAIVNRPFRQGVLIDRLKRGALPGFAAELGCTNWASLALKFIVSHPAVTCTIPATTRVDHLRENMEAARGPMPDAAMRARIAAEADKI